MKPNHDMACGESAPFVETLTKYRNLLLAALESFDRETEVNRGLERELAVLEDEKRDLARKAEELKTGTGPALELGRELAAIDHARDILSARVEAKQQELQPLRKWILKRAHSVRRNGLETGQAFFNAVAAQRMEVLAGLLKRWGASQNFERYLKDMVSDSADFQKVQVQFGQLRSLPGGGEYGCEAVQYAGLIVDAGRQMAEETKQLPPAA